MLGRRDPATALENASTPDVIFPNDEYPPGFPCTSGCGKKFPTVILQEIHTQHYCEGPYDEIEFYHDASVAASRTPSTSSVSDRDGTSRGLSSGDTGQLEHDSPSISNYDAMAVEHSEDGTSRGPSSAGTGHLEHDSPSISNYDAMAVDHSEDGISRGPSSGGTGQLEHDPPSISNYDAMAVDHSEDGISRGPSSGGTGQLEHDPPSISNYDAMAVDHSENFKCPFCGKCLTDIRSFNRHKEAHESGKVLCPVNKCRYHSGKTKWELDFHMREKHPDIAEQREGERFACWYCGRNMKARRQLLVHVRFHEVGRFPCPINNCSSSVLLSQHALDQHLKKIHKNVQMCGSLL